jgi:hypothetical protein
MTINIVLIESIDFNSTGPVSVFAKNNAENIIEINSARDFALSLVYL